MARNKEKDPFTEAKKIRGVREFLQKLGTEFGRDVIDQDIWINYARKSVNRAISDGATTVFLTGIRFKNELELVREFDNYRTVWVERTEVTKAHTDSHASEHGLTFAAFGAVIFNDGTLEELKEKVQGVFR